MNKKTLKLVKKAGFVIWEDESWGPGKNKVDWASEYDDALEKLVELVVRDCAKTIDKLEDSMPFTTFGDLLLDRYGLDKPAAKEKKAKKSIPAKKLVDAFLAKFSHLVAWYAVRDNCGQAALDFINFAKDQGYDLVRVQGYFLADTVVCDKEVFTREMYLEFKKTGLNWNSEEDRRRFLENNEKYAQAWKKVPHYWVEDMEGTIYDPSGHLQFIESGLSEDLCSYRYEASPVTF